MQYVDMEGMQGYIDENGNIVYVDAADMMDGSDEDEDGMGHHMNDSEDEEGHGMGHGDSYGHEGSPGYGDDDHYGDVSTVPP